MALCILLSRKQQQPFEFRVEFHAARTSSKRTKASVNENYAHTQYQDTIHNITSNYLVIIYEQSHLLLIYAIQSYR